MLENEHKVLRFVAKMISPHKQDADRRFVISYRLADDMMTIYEPPQRNAGVLGGKFLERTRVLKNRPKNSLSSVTPLGVTESPEYYNANDLWIGAVLDVHTHRFVLLDADEYVFNYMESRPQEFPQSGRASVLEKFKGAAIDKESVQTKIAFNDRGNSGVVDRRSFIDAVKSVSGNLFTEHVWVLDLI